MVYEEYISIYKYNRPKMLLYIILMVQLSGTFKRNSINLVYLQSINLQKKFKAVKTMAKKKKQRYGMGMQQHANAKPFPNNSIRK